MTSRRKIFSLVLSSFPLELIVFSPQSGGGAEKEDRTATLFLVDSWLCWLSDHFRRCAVPVPGVVLGVVRIVGRAQVLEDRKSSFRAKTRYRREQPLTPSSRPASPQTYYLLSARLQFQTLRPHHFPPHTPHTL